MPINDLNDIHNINMTNGSGKHALEKDHICFEIKRIHIGSSIAMFFFKQGVSDVLVEFNFNDKSMILEAVTPEKIKSGRCINGLSISSTQPEKKQGGERWIFLIQTVNHNKIINMNLRNLKFKGTLIAKDKISFKGIPFLPSNTIMYNNFIIDMNNNTIAIQSAKDKYSNVKYSNVPAIGQSQKWIGQSQKWIEKLRIEKERQGTNQPADKNNQALPSGMSNGARIN